MNRFSTEYTGRLVDNLQAPQRSIEGGANSPCAATDCSANLSLVVKTGLLHLKVVIDTMKTQTMHCMTPSTLICVYVTDVVLEPCNFRPRKIVLLALRLIITMTSNGLDLDDDQFLPHPDTKPTSGMRSRVSHPLDLDLD